ncbi:hypothetical protein TNCV_3686161 [Trichonephila clavipes]|nr:hypothetical protein TNCV_3686161 [Trichonephila clavipes]
MRTILDESRFSLSLDSRRQLIWRESGTAYRPENIQEKDGYPTCSTRCGLASAITAARATCGCEWDYDGNNDTLMEVLLPHVRLFRGAVGRINLFLWMTTQHVIEHSLQVAGRNYPPTNKNTLIRTHRGMDKLPQQQLLDNVVQSMVRRVGMLHHTPRWTSSRTDNFL